MIVEIQYKNMNSALLFGKVKFDIMHHFHYMLAYL